MRMESLHKINVMSFSTSLSYSFPLSLPPSPSSLPPSLCTSFSFSHPPSFIQCLPHPSLSFQYCQVGKQFDALLVDTEAPTPPVFDIFDQDELDVSELFICLCGMLEMYYNEIGVCCNFCQLCQASDKLLLLTRLQLMIGMLLHWIHSHESIVPRVLHFCAFIQLICVYWVNTLADGVNVTNYVVSY